MKAISIFILIIINFTNGYPTEGMIKLRTTRSTTRAQITTQLTSWPLPTNNPPVTHTNPTLNSGTSSTSFSTSTLSSTTTRRTTKDPCGQEVGNLSSKMYDVITDYPKTTKNTEYYPCSTYNETTSDGKQEVTV